MYCLGRLGLGRVEDLATLLHHVGIQDIRAWHIHRQDGIEDVLVDRRLDLGDLGRDPDERALAKDAEGVEDEEGIVSQLQQELGAQAEQGRRKEAVADDFGGRPGEQHGGVPGGRGDEWVRVDDGPDEEEARGDLHDGGDEGSSNDAWHTVSKGRGHTEAGGDFTEQGVDYLHGGGGLGPSRPFADFEEDGLVALVAPGGDGVVEDDAPCGGGEGVVEDQVARAEGGHGGCQLVNWPIGERGRRAVMVLKTVQPVVIQFVASAGAVEPRFNPIRSSTGNGINTS